MTALHVTRSKLSSRAQRVICLFFSPCIALYLFALLLLVQPASAIVQYEVSLANPSEHFFHVTMTVYYAPGELVLQLPAWNALYQIRDFSSRAQQVTAESESHRPLAVEKVDKQTWYIHANGTVIVHYAIYWDAPGPFASQLNEEHAFVNPATVFMYVPIRRAEPVALTIRDVPPRWDVAASLNGVRVHLSADRFVFSAPNYDALADEPIEIGTFTRFTVPGVTPEISVAVHGDSWKQADVETTLRKLCAYELQLMGGAPFDRFLFILHIGKGASGAGGGMEHANSTAINVGSDQQLAGVAAHEFFHLWNVKRIRPASLEPVDYTKEQYTRALWFAEGVTSTYGRYAQLRSGLWTKEQFYEDLGQQITELESRPANRWQSAEQSSLDAWLEKYPYYNGADFSVSYYTKGQVLGVLLDILIRGRTNDARSLDDVMRKMNEDFAKQGKTYRDSLDVRLTAEAVAGGSFEDFFRKYVAAAEPLPYGDILATAGLLLQKQEITRAELGFTLERDANGRAVVRSVTSGSTSDLAGLRAGDELETWNGEGVPRRAENWLRNRRPGETLRLQVLRNGQPRDVSFGLGGATAETLVIEEDPQASAKARSIREGLLHGDQRAVATVR